MSGLRRECSRRTAYIERSAMASVRRGRESSIVSAMPEGSTVRGAC